MDEEPRETESRHPADGEPAEGEAQWDAGATAGRGRQRWSRYAWLAVAVLLIAGGAWAWKWNRDQAEARARWQSEWAQIGVLEPSGGMFFKERLELPVPLFCQGDPQWRADLLGPTQDSLGATGCAITSVAMVLSYYGVETDPQRLNRFLNGNGGYTPEGWVYWEKAAELAPERVKHIYEDLGSYQLLDENLLKKNPVIVKLRLPSGTTHFVVVAGKEGYDYLTRDPGAGSTKGMYPLRELHSKILGLRYYEKL